MALTHVVVVRFMHAGGRPRDWLIHLDYPYIIMYAGSGCWLECRNLACTAVTHSV